MSSKNITSCRRKKTTGSTLARTARRSVAVPHEVTDERKVESRFQVAVEAVLRDELFEGEVG